MEECNWKVGVEKMKINFYSTSCGNKINILFSEFHENNREKVKYCPCCGKKIKFE